MRQLKRNEKGNVKTKIAHREGGEPKPVGIASLFSKCNHNHRQLQIIFFEALKKGFLFYRG